MRWKQASLSWKISDLIWGVCHSSVTFLLFFFHPFRCVWTVKFPFPNTCPRSALLYWRAWTSLILAFKRPARCFFEKKSIPNCHGVRVLQMHMPRCLRLRASDFSFPPMTSQRKHETVTDVRWPQILRNPSTQVSHSHVSTTSVQFAQITWTESP